MNFSNIVIVLFVLREDIAKLLQSKPFNSEGTWKKGPYSMGCLEGFLQPCSYKFIDSYSSKPIEHIEISNSNKIYYAERIREGYDPKIVIVLDPESSKILVYKHTP